MKQHGGAVPPRRGPSPAEATRALAARACAEAAPTPAAADTAAALASARAEHLRHHGRLLASTLRSDWPLAEAFFLRGEASLDAALSACATRRVVADASRAVIKDHHQRLRVEVAAAVQPPAADAAAAVEAAAAVAKRAAWARATADEAALDAYASAAAETGRRGWVRAAQQWCLATAREHFFGGGAARVARKAARRAHFAAHGVQMPAEDAAAVAAAAQAAVDAALGPAVDGAPAALRLVDIGSCHDPWRAFEPEFAVRPVCC